MKIDTLGYLVDTQDLYQALAEVKSGNLPQETKAYVAHKIRETCKMMRDAAKYVEERIDLFDPPPPKPKRSRRPSKSSRG